jgi:RimJ/RimL family protein N-acetyltransferase
VQAGQVSLSFGGRRDRVLDPLELRSSRLCLRRLRPDDAAAIAGYRSLPEVARFQSWESFGPTDAAELIAAQVGVEPGTPGTWLQLALVAVESAEVIGDCGVHFRADNPRQVEVGITLAPAHQGRGLAAEALGSVLDFVFGRLGTHRVSAVTDAENHAAAGLLRRLGFRQEAHHVEHVWFKGAWGSEYVFALLLREWQERRNNRCT